MHETHVPSREMCKSLLRRYGTSDAVIAHGEAVARCALELAEQSSHPVDRSVLEAACLLHDIVKGTHEHAAAGAQIAEALGCAEVAAAIRAHHDLPETYSGEAALLYLADKLVQGDQRVTLEQRFSASRKKCMTPEALQAWQQRYEQAERVWRTYLGNAEKEHKTKCHN